MPAGLDINLVIARLGGDPACAEGLLRCFYDNHVDSGRRIADYLQLGALDETRRLSHNLKGIAGTLGLQPLQQAAEALDRALQVQPAGPSAFALSAQLSQVAAEVMPALATWLQRRSADDAEPAQPARPDRGCLQQLARQLSEWDPAAADSARELRRALAGSAFEAAAEHLLVALDRFDFAAAESILGKLQAASPEGPAAV